MEKEEDVVFFYCYELIIRIYSIVVVRCGFVELCAMPDKIPFYEKLGFDDSTNEKSLSWG